MCVCVLRGGGAVYVGFRFHNYYSKTWVNLDVFNSNNMNAGLIALKTLFSASLIQEHQAKQAMGVTCPRCRMR